MINQKYYLKQMIEAKDNGAIKIITGMRYTGKSELLKLYKEELIENHVEENRILTYRFDDLKEEVITDSKTLEEKITQEAVEFSETGDGHFYLFLDEIGKLPDWAAAVNRFRTNLDCDIYIAYTGWLGDISEQTGGIFTEIRMFPVPFTDFLKANGIEAQLSKLQEGRMEIYLDRYMEYGALPVAMLASEDIELAGHLLRGMLSTIMVKDIIHDGNVRDVTLLEIIMQYIAENMGEILSVKQISDYITRIGRKTMPDTVDSYLQALEDSGLIYRMRRFDLKTNQIMKTGAKYYFVDTGLRNVLTGYKFRDYERLTEAVVYAAFARRGYNMFFAKSGNTELGFVAIKGENRIYAHVVSNMRDETNRRQAIRQMRGIKDNYRKIIITRDTLSKKNIDGIECANILEFLVQCRSEAYI